MITKDEIDFLRESNNIENEWDDVSLSQAILAWNYLKQFDTLTEENILETHNILMQYHLDEDKRGKFRLVDVYMRLHDGSIRKFKPFYAVPYAISQWIESVNDTKKNKRIERVIKEKHIMFEGIHPFIDGNGRTGRILMNWQRLKFNLPILVIKEREKSEYYKWFGNYFF